MSLKFVGDVSLQENILKTKQHVESVRSALDAAKQNQIQYTTLPTAAAQYENMVLQYIGESTVALTSGCFYVCKEITPATDPKTYEWVELTQKVVVDSSLSSTSENPVENQVITEAIQALQAGVIVLYAAESDLPTTIDYGAGIIVAVGTIAYCVTEQTWYSVTDINPSSLAITWSSYTSNIATSADISKHKNIFIGTREVWETLSLTERKTYDEAHFKGDDTVVDLRPYQKRELDTPIEIGGTEETTVEGSLNGLNTGIQTLYGVNSILGAHNLFSWDLEVIRNVNSAGVWNGNKYTFRDVIFTFNEDGTIEADGTASENLVLSLSPYAYTAKDWGGKVLSGCTGGSTTTYCLYSAYSDDGSTWSGDIYQTDEPIVIPDAPYYQRLAIIIKQNVTLENQLFKPMLRIETDEDDSYQPYTKTNAELTEGLESLTKKFSKRDAYIARQGEGTLADFNLIGGTIALNQVYAKHSGVTDQVAGCTISVDSDGYVNVTGTANATGQFTVTPYSSKIPANHVCLMLCDGWNGFTWRRGGFAEATQDYYLNKHSSEFDASARIHLQSGETYNIKARFCSIDLTLMFGTEIANYIYLLEQTESGSGVAWFRQYFNKQYYAYNTGSLQSVKPSGRKVTEGNLDITLEQGSFSTSGVNGENSARIRTAGYISVTPETVYYINSDLQHTVSCFATNTNQERINGEFWNTASSFVTPVGCNYIRVMFRKSDDSDILPQEHYCDIYTHGIEYPISPIEIRGIPKLVDNKLSYDGDIYYSDGKIERKYGIIDLGTLTWNYYTWSGSSAKVFTANVPGIKPKADGDKSLANILCSKYTTYSAYDMYYDNIDKSISTNVNMTRIIDDSYTSAADFKAAMSGVYLVYELETSIANDVPVYQNPQMTYNGGVERFIDNRDIAIPVGNNTSYQISEVLPSVTTYVESACKQDVDWKSNGILGAKNFFFDNNSSGTLSGITSTKNADGTWTFAAGTVGSSPIIIPSDDASVFKRLAKALKPNTTYKFSVGTTPTSYLSLGVHYKVNDSASWTTLVYETSNVSEIEFTTPSTFTQIWVRFVFYQNAVITTTKISPMIRIASDSDDTYQPYTMSNHQLTDLARGGEIITLPINTEKISSGTVQYMIRGGFCYVRLTAIVPKAVGTNLTVVTGLPKAKMHCYHTGITGSGASDNGYYIDANSTLIGGNFSNTAVSYVAMCYPIADL